MTQKILFVAMQMSEHTVRWINQITDQNWEVHLFPVNHLPVHPDLKGVTIHQPLAVLNLRQLFGSFFCGRLKFRGSGHYKQTGGLPFQAIYPFPVFQWMLPFLSRIKRVSLGTSDSRAPALYGPRVLSQLLEKIKPDLIHSLEFQHCGYLVLKAREHYRGEFPTWLATNWGSDIYYYRRFKAHCRQIERLFKQIDYYSCECERDVNLAKGLGYAGWVLPVMPNAGGLDIKMTDQLRCATATSQRKIIMVKGYQHFVGRALTALDAVNQCASVLKEFKVIVFSASPQVCLKVNELNNHAGLNIHVLPHTNHGHMLQMFSQARIYLGVSESDAISTSMLEAMAMGAFPIQTDTSCCNEWYEDFKGGFHIPFNDSGIIADRLRRAILDDQLVDNAAQVNWKTVRMRLDQKVLKQKAVSYYHTIFNRCTS